LAKRARRKLAPTPLGSAWRLLKRTGRKYLAAKR
jgi:hypothetical protein